MSCPACFQGRLRTDLEPAGRKSWIHGLNCYVARPADNKPAKGIVVIVPDAFGWGFLNNQLLADEYARLGQFEVYLPDFMAGNHAPLWVLDTVDNVTQDFSLTGWLTKPYHVVCALYGFVPFLYRNSLSVTMPRVTSFIAGLRNDPQTASLPVGVAGFCWGGQHIVRLCWDHPELSPETDPPLRSLIDAAFTAHPSGWKVPAEIEKVRKPLCIAAGNKDHVTPIANIQQAKEILQKNGVKHELKVYKGAGHGWSVRIDRKNKDQKEQAEDCERLAVAWFTNCFESEVP